MASFDRISFAEGIRLQKLDTTTYKAQLDPTFCIGAVPNGGYSSSCLLAAAATHLGSRGQTDTLNSHFEFLNRTKAGPAIITVEELKIGSKTSTLHLTLWQGDGLLEQAPWVTPSVTRRTILAYATQTNLAQASGLSMPTGYSVVDAASRPAKPDLDNLLKTGRDKVWVESPIPKGAEQIMSTLKNWRMFIPKRGPLSPGTLDMWMCTSTGEPLTQAMLPYIVDSFPYNMHIFLASPDYLRILATMANPPKDEDEDTKKTRATIKSQQDGRGELWLPTVVMNLETRNKLPSDGVKWLNMRGTSKQIQDGNFDMEIVIRDEAGKLIAVSQHTAMILSMERNRGKKPKSSL